MWPCLDQSYSVQGTWVVSRLMTGHVKMFVKCLTIRCRIDFSSGFWWVFDIDALLLIILIGVCVHEVCLGGDEDVSLLYWLADSAIGRMSLFCNIERPVGSLLWISMFRVARKFSRCTSEAFRSPFVVKRSITRYTLCLLTSNCPKRTKENAG